MSARWIVGVVLLAFAAACVRRLPSATHDDHDQLTYSVRQPELVPNQVTVPLERRGDLFFVNARINGGDVGVFLLDTGADMTFVDRGVADRLNLPELVDVEVGGIHQSAGASLCTLDRLTIGDVQLDSTATLALPLDDLSARAGRPVAGIIGFPTLGSAPFTIDFPRATLTLYNPGRFEPPANVASEQLAIHQYAPYVEATLGGETAVSLLLDSGSVAAITLWDRFVKAHPHVLGRRKRHARSTGLGGSAPVTMATMHSLRVLGRDLHDVTAIVQSAPPQTEEDPRAAGILGLGVLGQLRITIDPVTRRIWAETSAQPEPS